jgi:hypothetical protein
LLRTGIFLAALGKRGSCAPTHLLGFNQVKSYPLAVDVD